MNDARANDDSPAGLRLPAGVTCHEYGRTRGYLVRLPAGEGAKEVRRLFSYGVHGGKEGALAAALAFRQGARPMEAPARASKRVPGYGYVRRTVRRYSLPSGERRQYEAFVAVCWDENGRMQSTNWSVDAHGEGRAQAECERWLERQQAAVAQALGSGRFARTG